MLRSDYESRRPDLVGATVALSVALTLALAVAKTAAADTLLRCSTSEVVITSGPRGEATARGTVNLSLLIDDPKRTVALGDAPMAASRFDRDWITAEHDGVIYDLDRRNHALSYAGSRASDATVTTIFGSGSCVVMPSRHS